MNEVGITDLDDVKPATITRYLVWAKENNRKSVPAQISNVTSFFDWLFIDERRAGGNPVVKKFHSRPKVRRNSRPLKRDEEVLLWNILDTEGSPMLRLAAAIGEESGLRASEVCNLRLHDVFLKEHRLFVRLPNKGMKGRMGKFGEQTRRYYIEWMAKRRTDIDHDGLLHNRYGGRLRYHSLRDEYWRTLSTLLRSTRGVENGFARWLTHRLRHTFTTNMAKGGADAMIIKELGGWSLTEAMEGYLEQSTELVSQGYEAAMKKAAKQKEMSNTNRVFTLAEALERKRAGERKTESEARKKVAKKDCV